MLIKRSFLTGKGGETPFLRRKKRTPLTAAARRKRATRVTFGTPRVNGISASSKTALFVGRFFFAPFYTFTPLTAKHRRSK